MLAIPLLLGLAAARPVRASTLLLVPGMALLFTARYAALPAVTRVVEGKTSPPGYLERRLVWTGLYSAGSLACLGAAAAAAGAEARPAALAVAGIAFALGSLHTGLAVVRKDRTLGGEVVGMAALAAGAPLVSATGGRPVDRAAIGLAAACLVYFVSTAVFVRTYERRRSGREGAVAGCLAAHAALAAALAGLWAGGWVAGRVLLAFVPVALRLVWGLTSPPANVRLLGWREAGVAAAFAVIAVLALIG